jgi:CheY-like chemotaxis protein
MRRLVPDHAPTLIAITGWGQKSDKERALAAGFDHHFTKPIHPDEIARVLQAKPSH